MNEEENGLLSEQSVLGAMLLSGEVIRDISEAVTGPDFYRPAHELIFRVIMARHNAGVAVDPVTVSADLDRSGDLTRAGGTAYVHTLAQVCPSPAAGMFYADIVARAARRRRLYSAGQRVMQLAREPGDEDVLLEAARKAVDETARPTTALVQSFGETVDSTLDALDKPANFHPTPWSNVNRIIGGLRPGCLYVIGARPGVGKTTFALQLAKHLTRYGAVSFSSLEMSRNDINMRVIAQDLKMDLSKLLDRRLTPSDWAKISERRGAWEKMPLMINDQSTSSVIDVQRHARSVSRRQPLAAVFVDYLQLMSQPAGYRGERHQFIADSSRQLKLLAMEMDIPVVALSQLNRGSESRADRVPQMSDLRESGAVEQDADVVTLMHREILGDNQMDLSLIVAKNRHGTTDTANLDFHGSISTVGDHGARVYDLPAARTPWRPDVDAQALAAGDH